ncbi:MAG: LytTR family DNA-binding domain-containing protein [Bacteroidota bacterium]
MNYLIIDDEPLAHKVIEKYTISLNWLTKVGNAYDAFKGFEQLNSQIVDLLFLDIHMPKLKGLDFLRTLANPPLVIITSAYREYALEGFELNVCDYLLKPFSLERFLVAVNKAASLKNLDNAQSAVAPPILEKAPSKIEQIFIKGDKKYHQVALKDIQYLESYGSYVKVFLADQMILTHETTSHFEQILPKSAFLRIHKSYIVSISKIEIIEGNRLKIGEKRLPIGNFYKKAVKALIQGNKE